MMISDQNNVDAAIHSAIVHVGRIGDDTDPRLQHAVALLKQARDSVAAYMSGKLVRKSDDLAPFDVEFTDRNHFNFSLSAGEREMRMFQNQIAKQMDALNRHDVGAEFYKFEATLTTRLQGTWLTDMSFTDGVRLRIGLIYDQSHHTLKVPLK